MAVHSGALAEEMQATSDVFAYYVVPKGQVEEARAYYIEKHPEANAGAAAAAEEEGSDDGYGDEEADDAAATDQRYSSLYYREHTSFIQVRD